MRIIPSDGILIHTEQLLVRPHKKKKNCLLYPYLPTFNPPPPPRLSPNQNFFWHFWKMKHFLALFSSENHDFFPMMEQWKKKKNNKLFFPTYLPNQKNTG